MVEVSAVSVWMTELSRCLCDEDVCVCVFFVAALWVETTEKGKDKLWLQDGVKGNHQITIISVSVMW